MVRLDGLKKETNIVLCPASLTFHQVKTISQAFMLDLFVTH